MIKQFFLVIFFALTMNANGSKETVYLLTVAKSGTHCLIKYFDLLQHHKIPIPVNVIYSHFSEEFLGLTDHYFEKDEVKKIILVRDFRDVFLSALDYIEWKNHWITKDLLFSSEWVNLSKEEKIIEMISYNKRSTNILWNSNGMDFAQYMVKLIDSAIDFSKRKNSLLIKYESLSGCLGKQEQIKTMKKINCFVGITNLKRRQYEYLANNLFGNNELESWTFRTGGMNKWESQMSDQLQDYVWSLYENQITYFGYKRYCQPCYQEKAKLWNP